MRVLITTTRELNLSGEHVRVEEFTSDQAVEYLTRVSGDPDRDGAGEVAEALGFLPLALTQAGAYIDLYGYGYLDYLRELRGQSLDVSLEQPDGEPYPRLVGVALQLAFRAGLEQIQDRDSDAAAAAQQVLDVVSLLAESGVPRDWLYRVSDAEAANRKAVGLLLRAGVLARSADRTVVSLHQLQSRVWRETLLNTDQPARRVWQIAATTATARVLSRVTIPQGADWETKARPTAQELASQLVFLSGRVGSESTAGEHAGLFWGVVSHPEVLAASINAMRWCVDAGLPGLAVDLAPYTRLCEQTLGTTHPDTLTSRNNLAGAYQDAGKLDQAIILHEQTLADRERILGPRHPHTLTSRNNLAYAYKDAGKLDQAITLHKQTLADRERILGPRHRDTLTSRNNLALAYKDAGNLDQAIALFEQTLTDQEQILGPRHPAILTSRGNLALAYQDAGNLNKAIALFEQTLTDTEQALGPRHPDTLTSRNNLATAYQDAGKLDQAITLYEQNLTDRERILGPHHPHTLTSRNNLALAYRDAGDLDQAIPLFEQNLTDQEQILGPRHPHTLTSRNNLATAYQDAAAMAATWPPPRASPEQPRHRLPGRGEP